MTTRLSLTTRFPRPILSTKCTVHLYTLAYIISHYQSTKWLPAIPLHTYLPQHVYICILFVLAFLFVCYCCFCPLLQLLYLTAIRPSPGRKDVSKLTDWLTRLKLIRGRMLRGPAEASLSTYLGRVAFIVSILFVMEDNGQVNSEAKKL